VQGMDLDGSCSQWTSNSIVPAVKLFIGGTRMRLMFNLSRTRDDEYAS